MSVQHDRPGVGDDFSKQIQTTIHLDSSATNVSLASNDSYTEVTLTVYTVGYVLSYSQVTTMTITNVWGLRKKKPLAATYSDVQSTGVGFGWSLGTSNASITLGISAVWNSTWVYDPGLSVLVDGKQGDGGGYDTTLMAILIPSIVVPLAIFCSAFIILLTTFIAYMRNRRIATRDRVNFA